MKLPCDAKILVIGANGQVGRALMLLLGPKRGIPATRLEMDFNQPEVCLRFLHQTQPTLVINASAHTQVDRAETEVDLAYQINAHTPQILSNWCQERQIPWIHFSTDYVFPGTGHQPWKETDPVGPQNVYGKSKLQGEQNLVQVGGSYLILRTSWVYDAQGKNFLTTLLRLAQTRESLSIVEDQKGAPTYAWDLASATLSAVTQALQEPSFPSGIYHLCNSGETSWFRFAEQILAFAKQKGYPMVLKELKPILSAHYPTAAVRPLNSRLSTEKFFRTFGVILPPWEESLEICMEQFL